MIDEEGSFSKYHADGVEGVNFTANPPAAKTGAPGEGNCTDCHNGSTQSAAGTITYNFSDANDEYLPGQTYTIDLSIASGAKNGFQMTILDASDNAAGTFTAGTNSGTTSSGGREYIRQTSATGVTSWSFDWNAPASDMGDLTVYYSFNATDAGGSTANDVVYLGQETISISGSIGMTKYEELDNSYNVVFNNMTRELTLNYTPLEDSRVVLNVMDLSGKLIYAEDLGNRPSQPQMDVINGADFKRTGVYIVSVLVGNYALNRKVMIH